MNEKTYVDEDKKNGRDIEFRKEEKGKLTRKITYQQATIEAQAEEMRRDPRVFLIGQDIRANMYGATGGLFKEFGPDRVRDTPIAELAMVGCGIGASMVGMRPIIDLAHCGFIYCSIDQIINNAAKSRYMYGGQCNVPITFRTSLTYGIGTPTVHAERNHAMLMSIPGIKVAVPTTAYDVKGMIKAAVREENPTIIFETPLLRGLKDYVPEIDDDYIVPFGQAAIRREGTDCTFVGIADGAQKGVAAAAMLESEGISVEVIDPRSLAPLDIPTIAASVKKTGRLVIYDPAPLTCSAATEISTSVSEEVFDYLKAPIVRLTAPNVTAPLGVAYQNQFYATKEQIAETIQNIVRTTSKS